MSNLSQREAEQVARDVAGIYWEKREGAVAYLIDLTHAVNGRDVLGGTSVLAVFAAELERRATEAAQV